MVVLFSPCYSWNLKSEMIIWQGWFLLRFPLLPANGHFLCLAIPFLCAFLCPRALFYKDTSHIGLRPCTIIVFYLYYLMKSCALTQVQSIPNKHLKGRSISTHSSSLFKTYLPRFKLLPIALPHTHPSASHPALLFVRDTEISSALALRTLSFLQGSSAFCFTYQYLVSVCFFCKDWDSN